MISCSNNNHLLELNKEQNLAVSYPSWWYSTLEDSEYLYFYGESKYPDKRKSRENAILFAKVEFSEYIGVTVRNEIKMISNSDELLGSVKIESIANNYLFGIEPLEVALVEKNGYNYHYIAKIGIKKTIIERLLSEVKRELIKKEKKSLQKNSGVNN